MQSDLTRLHPLERLSVRVNVSSDKPLSRVVCPSHPARIEKTGHAASVLFEAEEYVPSRDFEVWVETEAGGSEVTAIPHRRGNDGYFLLTLDVPSHRASNERRLLFDHDPMEILVVVDTSGSMAGPARSLQERFLEAFLGSLSARDRFNLMTVDVETRSAFDRPVSVNEESRAASLQFVARRSPLGWSDLGRGFERVFASAGPETKILYLGDGVLTRGNPDPAAFAARLERMHRGRGSVHAVSPGSSAEPLVLQALGRLGSGSSRTLTESEDPAEVAFALLSEWMMPSVKNLEVQFEGIDVAAVYPDPLPNVRAGEQLVLVGRYDIRSGGDRGEVVVAGTLDGKRVVFRAPVSLSDPGIGNSFIPRLWARRHLDQLLRQGATLEVKEQILALSEGFQIITPYTSFLVLESDEDRERFKVRKRFRMRDAEEFFAEGKDRADFALRQKAKLEAAEWLSKTHREIVTDVAGMGRDLTELLGEFGAILGPRDERLHSLGYLESRAESHTSSAPMDSLALRDDFTDESGLESIEEEAEDGEEILGTESLDELVAEEAVRGKMARRSLALRVRKQEVGRFEFAAEISKSNESLDSELLTWPCGNG